MSRNLAIEKETWIAIARSKSYPERGLAISKARYPERGLEQSRRFLCVQLLLQTSVLYRTTPPSIPCKSPVAAPIPGQTETEAWSARLIPTIVGVLPARSNFLLIKEVDCGSRYGWVCVYVVSLCVGRRTGFRAVCVVEFGRPYRRHSLQRVTS